MKAYIIPKMEIVKLETEDVITTSGAIVCSSLDSWDCSSGTGIDGGGIGCDDFDECDFDDWGGM